MNRKPSQVRVTVLTFALALACAGATIVRAQQPTGQRGQAAPAGPLAPTVYKNIQVLTDVPADQLELTMQAISADVGMPCLQCHVQDAATGEWAYDKDDKNSKKTARTMMKMVYTIRTGNFGVNTANCATCHNGKNRPPGLPLTESMTSEQVAATNAAAAARAAAPPAAPAGAAGAAPGQRAPQPPPGPPVEDVLAKYVAAIGGQANVAKLQSRVMSGTVTLRNGQSVPFTIEEKGGKYRETQTRQPAATSRGFDGTAGWMQTGAVIETIAGFPLQQTLRGTDWMLALSMKDKYPTLAAGRTAKIDGVDVNVLQATGTPTSEVFSFDANTGLLIRRAITTRTPMGTLTERVDYSDYKDVGGVKMPFTIKRTNWSAIDTLKVVDVKPNAQIDDARFMKPKG